MTKTIHVRIKLVNLLFAGCAVAIFAGYSPTLAWLAIAGILIAHAIYAAYILGKNHS